MIKLNKKKTNPPQSIQTSINYKTKTWQKQNKMLNYEAKSKGFLVN